MVLTWNQVHISWDLSFKFFTSSIVFCSFFVCSNCRLASLYLPSKSWIVIHLISAPPPTKANAEESKSANDEIWQDIGAACIAAGNSPKKYFFYFALNHMIYLQECVLWYMPSAVPYSLCVYWRGTLVGTCRTLNLLHGQIGPEAETPFGGL